MTGVAFLQFFPHRSDYAGHYLAGLGGTLVLLGCFVWLFRRPVQWWGIALVMAAVSLGVLTESTVFRIAIFDPVDLDKSAWTRTIGLHDRPDITLGPSRDFWGMLPTLAIFAASIWFLEKSRGARRAPQVEDRSVAS